VSLITKTKLGLLAEQQRTELIEIPSFFIAKLVFYDRRKLSILVFMFSRTLSLKASFLEIFSLILTCSKIKSLKDGCLELEEL
jgi:hypothetical protein